MSKTPALVLIAEHITDGFTRKTRKLACRIKQSRLLKRLQTKRHIQGLRQRWLFNTVVPIFTLLLLISASLSAGVSSYYYRNMQDSMVRQATTLAGAFNDYFMGNGSAGYRQRAEQTTSGFAADQGSRPGIELQFLDKTGRIQMSSANNLTAGTAPGTEDIGRALNGQDVSVYRGKNPETGEMILAVSCPLLFNDRVQSVMRMVTSLQLVNRQVRLAIIAISLVMILCMFLVIASNMLFINKVVEPIGVVSNAAKRIAAGSYGARIENKYTDELGELVDNINDMSLKIGRNEKLKSEFISSVSHELRTPLTAINGWGETLLEYLNDEPENDDPIQIQRGIRIIINEARRLSKMVEELLEFSKMEDGRFTIQVEPVDLQAEFEDAIFTYQELFRQNGIDLKYNSDTEELPPIQGDPERLKQVFSNVLDNATKHGGSGKRITASVYQDGAYEVVQVRDYGPGIPEEELPFVKQKFYKGTSKVRGSGIGLAVCDEIISLHNGELNIGNAEGGGTVVTIKLPMQKL